MAKWVVLWVVVLASLAAVLAAVALSEDSSTWIRDDKCITVYYSENHIFSADKEYVDTYCKGDESNA